ncbi:hypothetical protein BGZ79_007604 [Entomortierella chlamydospora]|nr:hypothetical protein BGZ79_007604 [Entomortierella chlamydospora]
MSGALSSRGNPFEHSGQNRKHSSAFPHTDRIDEEYDGNEQHEQETRHRQHNSSNSNGSSFSRNSTATGRTALRHPEGSSSSNLATADSNFRAGMKLVQQAYEDKYQALVEEVNTWKWISEEQSAQITAMATELSRVEESYAALQKEAIVSMVDQHSGVSLTQLEKSILETIEADAENGETGYGAIADADTSSFMLDDDTEPSGAPPSHQSRLVREDNMSKEQKIGNTSATAQTLFKNSLQPASSRPRASTEISTRRLGSNQNPGQLTNQSGYPPSKQSSSSIARNGAAVLTDNSPNGLKNIQKSESTDSLRSKRNTISSSARPIYPNTLLSSSTAKRHSSVSPLSPRTRASAPTSRAAGTSTSFSSNSTPSTSPRQQTGRLATSSTVTGSIATRTSRQQQQKEYGLNVRSSTSYPANLSVSPRSSASQVDRTTSAPQSKSSSSIIARSSQRSGSESLSTSGLSPAALKLIRQQEQQQLEEETEYKQKSSGSTRHTSHHQTDDEDHHRSVSHGYAPSSTSESSRPHRRKASESGHESVTHSHATGYESTSKYDSHRRQNSSYGDKHDSHSTSASVVTAFNEGDKTTEETLDEVSRIVKDRSLNQRFRDLIHQAIAEKENQLDNDVGNGTVEGDLTLEVIDQSLLLDDDQEPEGDHSRLTQKEEEHDEGTSIQGDESLQQSQADEGYPDESILEEPEQAPLGSDVNSSVKRNVMSSDEIEANDEDESGMAARKSTRKQTM